jgi:D-glycero-alpha-D-manno-heptose-7-phosphate kinase
VESKIQGFTVIITKTPFRISFVGGGSDIKAFYSQHQGAVLSTSINKYMYISSHRFFDEDKIRIKYSKTETVKTVDEIVHPIVREVLRKFRINGVEISSNADIPAGTGLGSSSSFTVGMLHNLYVRKGKFVTKEQLAEDACDIEITKLKEPIGKQDQYVASFGDLNIIKFNSNGSVEVSPMYLPESVYKRLESNLLMFYIGMQRSSSSILSEQKTNMKAQDKVTVVKDMVSLVWELRDSLYKGRLNDFGKILHQNWLLKRKLASRISNPEIDGIYDLAMKNGATGGKLLGAGGGGFFLLYCEKSRKKKLREAMSDFREIKFKFENEGSKVIYIGDEYERY